jgi:hypothetical protein
MPDEEQIKRRYREFLDLMPLTIALAGLAPAEGNRNFTSEQLELRSQVMINAYKVARKAVLDAIRES